jgi:hypothetical protein
MALIFVLAAAIKIVAGLIAPKSWLGLVKSVWKTPALIAVLSLVLGAISLYFLLQELTIIDIFAAMLFLCFLTALTASSYAGEIVAIAQKLVKDKSILKKAWLPLIVWIILIVWGISALLA